MRFLLFLISLPCFAISEVETTCLIQNIYHEARGESIEGKIAVGYVTINRLQNPQFPKTICGVVYQACQFTWSCAKNSSEMDLDEWRESSEVAKNLLEGKYSNTVKNSYYYYNSRLVRPRWRYCEDTIQIDNHTFCLTYEK